MNLHNLVHAPSRPTWVARLLIYIAVIVTLSLAAQFLLVYLVGIAM